jgi:hypothetical protein
VLRVENQSPFLQARLDGCTGGTELVQVLCPETKMEQTPNFAPSLHRPLGASFKISIFVFSTKIVTDLHPKWLPISSLMTPNLLGNATTTTKTTTNKITTMALDPQSEDTHTYPLDANVLVLPL